MMNGALVDAVPLRVPAPTLRTVKVWVPEHWPALTSPKFKELGVTSKTGFCGRVLEKFRVKVTVPPGLRVCVAEGVMLVRVAPLGPPDR
jgi:hypothetical protein